MGKTLVSYFSASGNTKKIAEKLANLLNYDIFEIEPVNKYTNEDLDWTSKTSRSTLEMQDLSSRPKIVKKVNNMEEYDTVVIGYPLWWYTAPTIVNTFIEENDLKNKKIYLLVTSWGTSEIKSFKDLKEKYPELNIIGAKRFAGDESDNDYISWLDGKNENDKVIVFSTDWDKVFPKNENVDFKKVTFKNHFGITLSADMYTPKKYTGKLPAIAVCGPYGAVKEQASGLYAQEMANRGFLAIAFDPSFTGESSGTPRFMTSYDINVEDYQAAIDYLINLDETDGTKVGIIGICGWGGIALQTACIDTRIKATIVSTMYDMSRVSGNGYNDDEDNEEIRYNKRVNLNNQRIEDYKNGKYKLAGGVIDPLPEDAPLFIKRYHEYYKTIRGYHPRSLNSNNGWAIQTNTSMMNVRLLHYSNEIRNAVMVIHGDKAHSYYMGKDAYDNMIKDSKYTNNKEFVVIKDADHCDLYDNMEKIPFDKIEEFLNKYL